jgi:hypothetical protein
MPRRESILQNVNGPFEETHGFNIASFGVQQRAQVITGQSDIRIVLPEEFLF